MKNKLLKVVFASFLVVFGVFSASKGSAKASETSNAVNLTSEEVIELKEFFNEYNVSPQTQGELIEKLEKGKMWDSMLKSTEVVNSYKIEKDGDLQIVDIYPDGSIVASTVMPEQVVVMEDNVIQPYGVDPGTATGGSGYKLFKKAKVYASSGIATVHFYADFTINYGVYTYDRITNLYAEKRVDVIGGTSANESLYIVRATETVDFNAEAILSFTYISPQGLGSTSCFLKLSVGKDTYFETHDL